MAFHSDALKWARFDFSRYGCERYCFGDNDSNPDFFANLMMIPKQSKSQCGLCFEVNYDHKKEIVRFLWGVRNDKVGGVVNPLLIKEFMVCHPKCLTIDKNTSKANADHWLVWKELECGEKIKNDKEESTKLPKEIAANIFDFLREPIKKDLEIIRNLI